MLLCLRCNLTSLALVFYFMMSSTKKRSRPRNDDGVSSNKRHKEYRSSKKRRKQTDQRQNYESTHERTDGQTCFMPWRRQFTQSHQQELGWCYPSPSMGWGHQPQLSFPQSYLPSNQIASDVEISKELARILRHRKYPWLHMDSDGYVRIHDILKDPKFVKMCGCVSMNDIDRIVNTNDKKRFVLEIYESELWIVATQGHTIEIRNSNLQPLYDSSLYQHVYHGTYYDAWEEIKMHGLSRMKRTHIHFATGLPRDDRVVSGMRKDVQVVIEIDLKKAMKAGLRFFVSSNGVILCEGDDKGRIHPKFFKAVFQMYPYEKIEYEIPADYREMPRSSSSSKKRRFHERK